MHLTTELLAGSIPVGTGGKKQIRKEKLWLVENEVLDTGGCCGGYWSCLDSGEYPFFPSDVHPDRTFNHFFLNRGHPPSGAQENLCGGVYVSGQMWGVHAGVDPQAGGPGGEALKVPGAR